MMAVSTQLLLFLSLAYTSALQATDVPKSWTFLFSSPQPPAYSIFTGESTPEKSGKDLSYLIWSKVEYVDAQQSKKGAYKTEIMYMRIRCLPSEYQVLRDIRYSAKGHVVSDISLLDGNKSKPFELMYQGSLGGMPLDETLVLANVSSRSLCFDNSGSD